MDIAELKKFEFLKHLSDQQLIMLVNNSESLKLKAGEPLIDAGTSDGWEYFLLAGELDLIPPEGHPVRTLQANSPDALKALVRQRPRPVNVVAHSAAAVLKVDLENLKNLLREAPSDSYEVRKALRDDQPEDKQLLLDIYADLRNNKLVLPSLPEVAVRIRQLIDQGT
ncbi:MAG: cyclic nucleotide-binding domain-containing protein, partial [Gammaproteobacteria bacterium]|nr:cyclic nucleotide-binding domain-containing protein [Gammaproteobacteria bacterium]